MADLPRIFVARAEARTGLLKFLSEGLRTLIEDKHLYQSVSFDIKDLLRKSTKAKPDLSKSKNEKLELAKYLDSTWLIEAPKLPGGPPLGSLTARDKCPVLQVPTVKLFCRRCKRVEAYNLVHQDDAFSTRRFWGLQSQPGSTLQSFLLGFLCQSCKTFSEVFLVRRENLKLTLCGRNPMAHVNVPSNIPKMKRQLYVGAIIAFQSGQLLPALFMLRTFIEQFAATQVSSTGLRADTILNKYMSGLPQPVREHFPSLREIYRKLSDAIHAAREDEVLFRTVLADVDRHFDARNLYNVAK
jgi:hypothetical protein